MEATRQDSETLVAVLVDAENVGLDYIQWLFDQISDLGRIIVKKAYADWSKASNKRDQLLELGIEPILQFHSGPTSKNSSDIRLAIDAVELLHQSPVDVFVIVSSDSDFVPLVTKLRAAGKTVIGAGHKATTARTLVISYDKYYYLDEDRRAGVTVQPSEEQSTQPLAVTDWDRQIDLHWSEKLPKYGHSLPGPVAAAEAAKVLRVSNLKKSQYKTLQGLLESSEHLKARWSREVNVIVKR